MSALTSEELAALRAWRARYGRVWGAQLNLAWRDHYYGVSCEHATTLARMRNERGPTWLARFRQGLLD